MSFVLPSLTDPKKKEEEERRRMDAVAAARVDQERAERNKALQMEADARAVVSEQLRVSLEAERGTRAAQDEEFKQTLERERAAREQLAADLQQQLEKLSLSHDEKVSAKISTTSQQFASEHGQLREYTDSVKTSLEAELRDQISQLQQKHESQLGSLQQQHQEHLNQVKTDFQLQLESLAEKQAAALKELAEQIKQTHQAAHHQQAQEISQLRADVASLSAQLQHVTAKVNEIPQKVATERLEIGTFYFQPEGKVLVLRSNTPGDHRYVFHPDAFRDL